MADTNSLTISEFRIIRRVEVTRVRRAIPGDFNDDQIVFRPRKVVPPGSKGTLQEVSVFSEYKVPVVHAPPHGAE
jgi:hypothetical protein